MVRERCWVRERWCNCSKLHPTVDRGFSNWALFSDTPFTCSLWLHFEDRGKCGHTHCTNCPTPPVQHRQMNNWSLRVESALPYTFIGGKLGLEFGRIANIWKAGQRMYWTHQTEEKVWLPHLNLQREKCIALRWQLHPPSCDLEGLGVRQNHW